jgi:dTDP-4-amino-4,6-dideoxygalactose transaminase
MSNRLVRLPFYNALSSAEQQTIIDAILSFFEGKG